MRRRLLGAAALATLSGLAACAALGPRDVTLSEAQLQSLIERQFPRERRLLEVLDVTLARPLVRLAPERNRIVTEFELAAVERLTGRSLRGGLALDHGLRFEPSDATLRLSQVRVNALRLDVDGTPLAAQGARLGALMAERLLDDFVLYRVSDDKREALRRAGIERAEVTVSARGVELKFIDKAR
jgi:hypothetical protein